MQNTPTAENFELVVGLEIHVQLNTASKIFATDATAFGALPNEHISEISMALPGALPVLNYEVLAKAVRMGLALNCHINRHNSFDRKHYFYADLPKGYQITQDALPVCVNGAITVALPKGEEKTIRINRIHLEEDAGKSIHDLDPNQSFVDLNRAGVPLIEIVTEPDIHSPEEAAALFTAIRKLARHLDVGDGNMEEGSLRCDANISIRPHGQQEFGTRCEVKNLNSIRNLRRAIAYEYDRQVKVIGAGGKIVQSTLNFDADAGTTSPMRTKEEANDYRYFPDPDLPPIHLSEAWLATVAAAMPPLPEEIAQRIATEAGVAKEDAVLVADDAALLAYYDAAKIMVRNKKTLLNWLNGPIRALLTEREIGIDAFKILPQQLGTLIALVEQRKITQQNALQQLLPALEANTLVDVFVLATEMNLLIAEDIAGLSILIDTVLADFDSQVVAYKKGKKGLMGLFVGEVMKRSGGNYDPKKVTQLLTEKLKHN